MRSLYYQPPTDKQFKEVKSCAIAIWQSYYDNKFGYVDEKVGQIKHLKNVGDNFMFIVAMFDEFNQRTLANMLSPRTRKAVADRIKAGGSPDVYNVFLQKKDRKVKS